jgi:hypothetical protein
VIPPPDVAGAAVAAEFAGVEFLTVLLETVVIGELNTEVRLERLKMLILMLHADNVAGDALA